LDETQQPLARGPIVLLLDTSGTTLGAQGLPLRGRLRLAVSIWLSLTST
jgi:hypothetical protein